MKKYLFGLLAAATVFTAFSRRPLPGYVPDPTTLDKKVMFGYQGWFGTPNDGSGNGVWKHWFRNNLPDSGHATFDYWPDMSEYPEDVQEATNLSYANGAKAKLFSAYKYPVVDLHFKWMKEHALDGVFEQRFVTELKHPAGVKHFNQVVRNVKRASEKYERVYCIMYDISGAGPRWKEIILADWKYLVDSLQVTGGSSYLHHKGRPLLAIWGLGFDHNAFATAAATDSLLEWLHNGAEEKYRATVMGGLNHTWLTQQDPWKAVFKKLDVISPWTVGRFKDQEGADSFAGTYLIPDKAYCDRQKIDYMPVIWPGFSWYNLRRGNSPFNQIPRNGGDFYWRQSYNVLRSGASMVYIAMYDEVDEGTAMFKIAPSADRKPVAARFVSLDQDGHTLRPDWYLRLAGATGNILRGKAPNSVTIPRGL